VIGDRLMAEVIEHPAFGTNRGTLDLLFGVTGDEEERDARFAGRCYGDGGARSGERRSRCRIPRRGWGRCGPQDTQTSLGSSSAGGSTN